MNNFFCLQVAVLGCLMVIGMSFAIEGKWKVTALEEGNLPSNH